MHAVRINRQSFQLPGDLAAAVRLTLDHWEQKENTRRLWRGDASLWTGGSEAGRLGWLRIVDDQLASIQHLIAIQEHTRNAGYTHALLLGMGGSSLAPEVMGQTFGKIAG